MSFNSRERLLRRCSLANLQWDRSMSVGVEVFDSQHKKILIMINDLSSAMEHRHGTAGVDKAPSKLE